VSVSTNNNETCSKCGQPMRLVHVVSKRAGLPEFKSFRCFFCNEVITKVVEAE
jgi:hypothetical protein